VNAKDEVGRGPDPVEGGVSRFSHLRADDEADHEKGEHDAETKAPDLLDHRPDHPAEECGPRPPLLDRFDSAGWVLEYFVLFQLGSVCKTG